MNTVIYIENIGKKMLEHDIKKSSFHAEITEAAKKLG